MKKRIFLILMIIAVLAACNLAPEPTVTPEPTATPFPEATPDPIIPPTPLGNVKFGLYDGSNLKLWDGTRLVNAYNGHVAVAGFRKIAIDDILYYMDEFGQSVGSRWLPDIPTVLTTRANLSKSSTVYSDDIFTLVDIPPAESYALGALYRHYTKVFENGTEIGLWNMNEWEVDRVITTASGHILAQDKLKHWHNLTDSKVIYNAYSEGIMVYNMDEQYMTASIADETGTYDINWSDGYFHHSRWQKADDKWYTENGFTWSNTQGLIENANKLYDWNNYQTYPESYIATWGEKPYILPAGVHEENGEEVLYWIETVTGNLYKFIPSINKLELVVQIYAGTGFRIDAVPYFTGLKPEIIDHDMMYHADGMIRKVDLITKIVSIFSPEEELIAWK